MSIADALMLLRPGAQFNVRGSTYAGIEWLDGVQTLPTQAEIAAEIARQAALPAPTLADKMDMTQFKVLLNHENRIRVLEGKVQITAAQFKAALTTLLGG